MSWKRGPLPAGTWNWGGVVPFDMKGTGFFFADFKGNHVEILKADGTIRRLEPHEVIWYNNALDLPPPPERPYEEPAAAAQVPLAPPPPPPAVE